MTKLPNCPKCDCEYTYENGFLYVCPECFHEWNSDFMNTNDENIIMDSNGNQLNDGDSVIVIKDLKVKGSSSSVKKGTMVKGIRLIHGSSDDHDIDCKVDGFGAMKLKSEFVKKA